MSVFHQQLNEESFFLNRISGEVNDGTTAVNKLVVNDGTTAVNKLVVNDGTSAVHKLVVNDGTPAVHKLVVNDCTGAREDNVMVVKFTEAASSQVHLGS